MRPSWSRRSPSSFPAICQVRAARPVVGQRRGAANAVSTPSTSTPAAHRAHRAWYAITSACAVAAA